MSGWKSKPLGNLAKSVDYGVTASAIEQPLGPKFLRITDIQNGIVDWESVPWCECDKRSASQARLKAGDIVFARTGATTGKSFLIRQCPANAVFASYLIRVRVGASAEPGFVSHFFQTPMYWAQIAKSARGVAQPGVNATTLKDIEIPLPPLAEQRRIAKVLDRAESLRSKRCAALAQLDSLTQSVFLDLFGDPIRNPKGWDTLSFESQIESVRYGTGSPPDYVDEGIPFIRATNIKGGRVLTKDLKRISLADAKRISKCQVSAGDLIVVRSGVNTGDAAVVPQELDGAYAAYDLIVRLNHSSAVFYNFLINSPQGKTMLSRLTRRAAQAHLNADQLRRIEFIAPPAELRREFARRVRAVEKLKRAQGNSLSEMNALFSSLQHRAFRGEL